MRAKRVLSPAHRVNNRAGLLHFPVLANRREQIGSLNELILWNAGNALHHLWCVARVLLLQ